MTVAACVLACVPAGLRWLRVAQREHYLPGSASRFAVRWWRVTPPERWPWPSLVAGRPGALGAGGRWPGWPRPPGWRPGPSASRCGAGPRRWPGPGACGPWPRCGRVLEAGGGGGRGGRSDRPPRVAAAGRGGRAPPGGPGLPDHLPGRAPAGHPLRRRGRRPAGPGPPDGGGASPAPTARPRPRATSPTWSRPSRTVVATPASFNNRAGLARAVNEHLADGTEVFVAEMGTYGPGEIAELCRWCPPDIAVITAIGPVHLERFGSEDRIVEAKSEILVTAAGRGPPGGRPPPGRGGRPGRGRGEAGPAVLGGGPAGRRLRGPLGRRHRRVGLCRRPDGGRGRAGAHRHPAHQPGLRRRRGPGARCRSRRHR